MSLAIHSAAALLALTASATKVVERSILCSDGIRLAAQHWKASTSKISPNSNNKILCLHGWMDNAASFNLLAPSLIAKGCASEVIALDFPGHGKSSHKSVDSPNQIIAEYAYYVAEAVDKINFDGKFSLIGHSMGAGVSVIYAAAWPDKIENLILLEGSGPNARNSKDFAKHVRKASEKRLSSNKIMYPQFSKDSNIDDENTQNLVVDGTLKGVRIYPSIEKAIETRMQTARLSPGKQYLSKEAAQVMVERSTKPAPQSSSISGKEVIFRHDPRLSWPSLQYTTYEQVEGLLEDIQCPTCVVIAEDGWPIDRRTKERSLELLKPDAIETFPGSHHFHADPNDAGAVIDFVVSFLLRE